MNRIGILLANACAGLALLVAAFGGVRSFRPASVAAHASITQPKVSIKLAADTADAQDDDDDSVIHFVKNPEPIPLFMAHDLDGNVISTAAYKGKVVLVNFWATWCPPCREEIPELIKLQDKYKDQMQVLAISEDEAPPEALKAFARQAHINYPVMKVTQEIETDFGGVPALPTLFVINKDGGIVQKHVGFYPVAVYDREIRALAGLSVDAKIETFEDTGQIFLKNAKNATELPGVDLSKLTPAQKQVALRRMNSETCTCGCRLTLAQCRINDTACPTSRKIANQIVQDILAGKQPESPAKSDDDNSTD
ncbi:MAG: TlpA disulfide reductase family protein [Candidatus Acidiferrales bacterium]